MFNNVFRPLYLRFLALFRSFFDPDRRWFSRDKLQHAVLSGLLCALLSVFFGPLWALGATIWTGVVWELAQWDGARSAGMLGQPGYGFGLRDLAANVAGALLALVLLSSVPPDIKQAIPEPKAARAAWAYVATCSHIAETDSTALAHVHWYRDSLIARHPEIGLLGVYLYPDTIVLDIWHVEAKNVIAHELLHYRIHISTYWFDSTHTSSHPTFPFVEPCKLMPDQWDKWQKANP